MKKSVVKMKGHGKVRIRLREIMDERDIKRNELAKSIYSRFEVVDNWYSGDMRSVDLDILAKLCYVLQCDISDILVYEREQKKD